MHTDKRCQQPPKTRWMKSDTWMENWITDTIYLSTDSVLGKGKKRRQKEDSGADGEKKKEKKKEMNTQSLNYAHSNFVPFHHFQLLSTAF